jgi:hypothetical protein
MYFKKGPMSPDGSTRFPVALLGRKPKMLSINFLHEYSETKFATSNATVACL